MPDICPRTVRGRYGTHQWPCTRAVGHQGECQPQIDARYYNGPLEDFPHAVLASEVRGALHQIERLRRDQQQDTTRVRLSDLIGRLEELTAGSRKTVSAADVRAALDAALGGGAP